MDAVLAHWAAFRRAGLHTLSSKLTAAHSLASSSAPLAVSAALARPDLFVPPYGVPVTFALTHVASVEARYVALHNPASVALKAQLLSAEEERAVLMGVPGQKPSSPLKRRPSPRRELPRGKLLQAKKNSRRTMTP